jgi:hypothetical protein
MILRSGSAPSTRAVTGSKPTMAASASRRNSISSASPKRTPVSLSLASGIAASITSRMPGWRATISVATAIRID